jgi:hypothetical protein
VVAPIDDKVFSRADWRRRNGARNIAGEIWPVREVKSVLN